jgi:HPt (histidine-containing phosphotransfer) domain-containing protein
MAVKRIQADEALQQFLRTLDLPQDQYLIEAGGKPIAGLVPPWDLENPDQSRQALLAMLQEVWERTNQLPEAVAERDVQEATRAVRARKRPRA